MREDKEIPPFKGLDDSTFSKTFSALPAFLASVQAMKRQLGSVVVCALGSSGCCYNIVTQVFKGCEKNRGGGMALTGMHSYLNGKCHVCKADATNTNYNIPRYY